MIHHLAWLKFRIGNCMPSTTIYEFNYYMNFPYRHSADPVVLQHLTHNPQLWSVLVLKLISTTPHISVSADRRQSPLSVCSEDFVSYDTSSSWNLHWCIEVLIVFCQTFLVVLRYGGSCKNRPFMLIPTVDLQEVSERKFNTTHLTSNQDFNTTQLKSNQPLSHFALLVHTTYVHTSRTNMNGWKITRCVRYRSATKMAQDFANKEIEDFHL